jgi:hypothetical protein
MTVFGAGSASGKKMPADGPGGLRLHAVRPPEKPNPGAAAGPEISSSWKIEREPAMPSKLPLIITCLFLKPRSRLPGGAWTGHGQRQVRLGSFLMRNPASLLQANAPGTIRLHGHDLAKIAARTLHTKLFFLLWRFREDFPDG